MAEQFRPRPVFQLTIDRAHPKGSGIGGLNCNPSAGATLVALVTCGARRTTGAAVRELTDDFEGGTSIRQVAAALKKGFGVEIDANTASFDKVVAALRARRGVTLSGSSEVTKRTRFQASESFDGNHQWALTDIRAAAGGGTEILVYDPLADGRRRGIATSPMWMPLSVVRDFAGKLDLRSPAEKKAKKPRRPLGIGRATYGVTEVADCDRGAGPVAAAPPAGGGAKTVRLRAGAVLVSGQSGRERAVNVPVARIRERPTTAADIVGRKRAGETFRAFQRIKGQRVAGSRIWFGDRLGDRWMHSSLFRALTTEADERADEEAGEDQEGVAAPDAADDQGGEDEVLEGTEDAVDEEPTGEAEPEG